MKIIIKSLMILITLMFSFSFTNANLDYVYNGLEENIIGNFEINTQKNTNGELLYGANLKLNGLYFYKNNYEQYLNGEYIVKIKWNENKTFSIISIKEYQNDNLNNPIINEKKKDMIKDKIEILKDNLNKLGKKDNLKQLLSIDIDLDDLIEKTNILLNK